MSPIPASPRHEVGVPDSSIRSAGNRAWNAIRGTASCMVRLGAVARDASNVATIDEESRPPERHVPIGTSERSWRRTSRVKAFAEAFDRSLVCLEIRAPHGGSSVVGQWRWSPERDRPLVSILDDGHVARRTAP